MKTTIYKRVKASCRKLDVAFATEQVEIVRLLHVRTTLRIVDIPSFPPYASISYELVKFLNVNQRCNKYTLSIF